MKRRICFVVQLFPEAVQPLPQAFRFDVLEALAVYARSSPLLANLYMNRMLKGWKQTQRGEQFRARIVSYADDFVILSRR